MLATALAGGVVPGGPAAAADTVITVCSDQALRKAVRTGGTIRFGVDCPSSAPLQLLTPLKPAAGSVVELLADGHVVVVDAGSRGRHFQLGVSQLTIRGLTLKGGLVRGVDHAGCRR